MFKKSLVNKILGLNLLILIAAFSLFIALSVTSQNKNIAGIIFIALVSILSTAIIIRLALKKIVADPVRDVIQHIKDVGVVLISPQSRLKEWQGFSLVF